MKLCKFLRQRDEAPGPGAGDADVTGGPPSSRRRGLEFLFAGASAAALAAGGAGAAHPALAPLSSSTVAVLAGLAGTPRPALAVVPALAGVSAGGSAGSSFSRHDFELQ